MKMSFAMCAHVSSLYRVGHQVAMDAARRAMTISHRVDPPGHAPCRRRPTAILPTCVRRHRPAGAHGSIRALRSVSPRRLVSVIWPIASMINSPSCRRSVAFIVLGGETVLFIEIEITQAGVFRPTS